MNIARDILVTSETVSLSFETDFLRWLWINSGSGSLMNGQSPGWNPWPAGGIWAWKVNGQHSPLPRQQPPNCPGARHLTPYLCCCTATTRTRLIAVQLPGVYVAVQWMGMWVIVKKYHTQAVKTFPEQINIKYDINTIPLWNYTLIACVCVYRCSDVGAE